MKALSPDLRRRIIEAWKKKKLTTQELAERFDVGQATVTRLKRRWRETGTVAPKAHGGGMPRRITPEQEPLVEGLVQEHPDWTEDRYAKELRDQHGIQASAITVGRVIRRLGYSVKKKRSSPANKTGLTSSADGASTSPESEASPLRIWFLWTKRARARR